MPTSHSNATARAVPVSIVTGAGSGIGRAIAEVLASRGERVVLAARTVADLEETARRVVQRGGAASVVPTDVRDRAAVARLVARTVEEHGRLDRMFANAGYGLTCTLAELPLEEMAALLQVNFYGVLHCVQESIPVMRARGSGDLVLVSSVLGRRALPTLGPYCISKFMLSAMAQSLRAEVAAEGLHVLLAEPGLTQTGFSDARRVIGPFRRHFDGASAMSAQDCAAAIVRALDRRKHRVTLTLAGRAMAFLDRWVPTTLDRMLARSYRKGSFQDDPPV